MTMAPRRIAGAALLLVAIAVLILGQGSARSSRDRSVRTLALQGAQLRVGQAREWLATLLRNMQGDAATAGALQRITSVASDPHGAALASTLLDGFREEPWWQRYRRDFSLQGFSFEGDKLDVINAVDGLDASKLDFTQLIQDARAHHTAALFLRGPLDWPYAAAASAVDAPRPVPSVLVLAKSFDIGLARELAKTLDSDIVLSDGAHALLSASPHDEERPRPPDLMGLQALPGHEKDGSYIGPDLSWAAVPVPFLAGATLWVCVSVAGQAKDLDADLQSSLLFVRLLAGALGLLGVLLVLWPAPLAPALAATGQTGQTGLPPGTPPGNTPVERAVAIRSGSSDPRLRKGIGTSVPPVAEDAVTAVQDAVIIPSNVFGRYVLLDLLGEGGMAEVFTAVTYGAARFRRAFVVKRLRAEMLRNQNVVSSFIDEANLASSLVHSNILPVFDFGKVGDEYYMATEYILGRDLGKLSRQSFEQDEVALQMPLVFFVAHQTLEALDYAHQKKGDDGKPLGIVHRDISPNNILISARGEVKLFDFGIAKAEGRVTQTAFGTVKGNVRFMSPEQARGDPVDSRSDLFSIALVIYYVLTGDTFYTAESSYSLLVKAAHGPGEVELANLAKLPKEAQRILERALRIDPNERYQTAAEFAQALAPYISGQQAALGRTMERLFGKELHEEQARFAAAAAGVGDAEKAEADPAGGST